MIQILKFTILLIAVSQLHAQSIGNCISTPVIQDFNTTRYLGKWYEIERFDYIFEKNLQCVNAQYAKLNETSVSVNNYGFNIKTKNDNYVTGYAYVPNLNEPNKLLVVLPVVFDNITIITNTGTYNVVDTDYDTFALVYSCRQIIPGALKLEVTWILSRTKTLDEQTVLKVKEIAKKYKIDISKFIVIDQSCNKN